MFEAFLLPGMKRHVVQTPREGAAEVRYAVLEPGDVSAVCGHIRAAADRARTISVQDRIHAIERALGLLTDPRSPTYQQAVELIPQIAGYSPEMVRAILDHIRIAWTRTAFERLVESELADPQQLDQFMLDPKRGRRTMAFGPALTAHIFSGNVPGVAVESLIRALLVKSASFGKLAGEEPVLPVLFAMALPDALRDTVALTHWPGGTGALEDALFQEADTIIVYGGEPTVDSVRRRAPPNRRIIVHGPRFSVGVIGEAAIHPDIVDRTAGEVAQAVALFDQQGCVSPHVVYVHGSYAAALEFGAALAAQLEIVQQRLPRGRISTAETLAERDARARAEFSSIAGSEIELLSGPAHTVVIDANPEFLPSCLNRFVYVKPLDDVLSLHAVLLPMRQYLQSVGVSGFDEKQMAELVLELGHLGVTRITDFTQLPWPPLDWHHDGSRPLGELLRWVDWES
jgi:acyl-CoA reductase-like NAD-dependent aldehyde dehydrogenase